MATVTYRVPLIPQGGNRTCWYAAAQMIVRWHRDRLQQSTLAGWSIDTAPRTRAVTNANAGLNPAAVVRFGRDHNLRMTCMSVTAEGLARLLESYGPLWYAGTVEGYRGASGGAHAVVITGIRNTEILINDPWPVGTGTRLTRSHDVFFQRLRAIGTAPFLHI